MADVPSDLKAVSPYLARARELTKAEPVIAYWCTFHALQQAMSLRSSAPESQAFLISLMDQLEESKAANASNEAFTDDLAASAYIENFGLKLFSQADNEDRKSKATRLTARKFLAAANFLELLSIFGEPTSENRDKIKYAKWKASDIAKAFREGRTPTPGPVGGLQEGDEDAVETSRVTDAEAKELSQELAALGTGDEARARPPLEGATPAESTTPATAAAGSATHTAKSVADDEPVSYPFPQQPTTLPSAPAAAASDDEGEEEEPGSDFVDDEQPPPSRAATPPVPSFLDQPASTSGEPVTPGGPVTPVPETHQTSDLPVPQAHVAFDPPAFPSAVFPSAPALPPQQPHPPPPHGAAAPPSARSLAPTSVAARAPPAAAAAAPPPVAPPPPRRDEYDPMEVAQMQKHCRWAVSALNYDDFETARKELRLALAMLGE
ncbi:uncharacterized protein RHOBADRAFT_51277 [Rhodotorula graminis WP1]|uniref:Vta1/callose synthase N-terminal domain-containing protein n=1 Tax=Rhodotorula graminis (strain WP1) TaxID=578459 RepID=A0A194S9Y7_RHOGW|nr:uncharacterized protein RHOBADRAFT_51277 [Rhodotorula graminis WP1]KPV77422.1 hypothetical protein RHOBADRAFT_51277 [Rhodotorula graminis WP1]